MAYKTKQRDMIFNILLNNKNRHMTAEELQKEILINKLEISRATLYRTLDSLTNEGKVKKIIVDDKNPICYQICDMNNTNHFHLICEKCGKLIHLDCDEVNGLIKHINLEHDFDIDPSRVVLYGLCKDCKISKN